MQPWYAIGERCIQSINVRMFFLFFEEKSLDGSGLFMGE